MDTMQCCAAQRVIEMRDLAGTPRKGIRIERCICGTHWLHAWEEIAMGDMDDEIDFDTYARLTPEEAARIPESPSEADFAFLADRTVFFTGIGGLQPRKGWNT
jgi:hypothetical protein